MLDRQAEYRISGELLEAILSMACEQPYERVVNLILAIGEVIESGPIAKIALVK